MKKTQAAPLASKLQQIVAGVKWLRPLPMTTSNLINALDNPRSTIGEISDLIGLDQALTAQVLQAANSTFFGYATDCHAPREAVMRLGLKRIRMIVMCHVAAGPLARRLVGYRLGAGELWNHAILAGTYSERLARYVRFPEPEIAYTAGLMHDLGKLLLDQYVMEDYQLITHKVLESQQPLWEVERAIFGVDHAEVGGMMAERWNFPPALVSAIRFHHKPFLSSNRPKLAAIVNIANAFTPPHSGLGDETGRVPASTSLELLGLPHQDLARLYAAITQADAPQDLPWITTPVPAPDARQQAQPYR